MKRATATATRPRRKHIRVEVSAYADLATVKADRRALRSILDNLLSNALRYTPEDGEILLAAEEIKELCAVHRARHRPRH